MRCVAGAAPARGGWVAVRLRGASLDDFSFHATLDELLAAMDDAEVVAVAGDDVPADAHVRRVVPERCFAAMAGRALEHAPRTWNGLFERLELLHAAGLRPARSLGGVGAAHPEDVLDAAAAAWTARRIAAGEARREGDAWV